MPLPRIARQGTVCLISIRGQAQKARIEKLELEKLELRNLSSMRVSNRVVPPPAVLVLQAQLEGLALRAQAVHGDAWGISTMITVRGTCLGCTTCLTLPVSYGLICFFYGITCLVRRSVVAALFAAFEENTC